MWDSQIQGGEQRFAKKNPKITVTESRHQERSQQETPYSKGVGLRYRHDGFGCFIDDLML